MGDENETKEDLVGERKDLSGLELVQRNRELEREIADLRKAEKALKDREKRLRAMLDRTSQFIGLMTTDGILIEANRAALDFYGLTESEVIGMPFWETPWWTHSIDQQERLREAVRKSAAGDFVRFEAFHPGPDGGLHNMDVSINPVKDDQGNVTLLIPEGRDITDQKKGNRRLAGLNLIKGYLLTVADLETKLKRITDGVVAVFGADFARIWIVRPGDRCNSGCVHAVVTEGPHVCRNRDRCLHLVSSSGRYTHLYGSIHRRVPFGCYKIGRVASGEIPKFVTNEVSVDSNVHDRAWATKLGLVSFAGYRLLSNNGQPVGVLGLFSKHPIRTDEDALLESLANTTAQVVQTGIAEEALRESEDRYRQLAGNSMSGIYIHQDGVFVYTNEQLAKMMGYSIGEIVGKRFWDFIHPADRHKVRMEGISMSKGERSDPTVCFRVTCKNGDTKFFEVLTADIMYQGRTAFMGNVADVTERNRSAEQLRLNEARLQSLYNISQYKADSLQDFLDFALNEAIRLTGSKVGYIYHYDEEGRVFELNTWSKEVMKQCEVFKPETLYDLDKTGIWGEAVRRRRPIVVNDFKSPNPLKRGYPEGHVELNNFMTIPVLVGEKIVAVVGAANKDSPYDESDVRQLSLLMDSVWRISEGRRSELVQRRLATALEHAAEGVVITDVNGVIQYVNPSLETMTGYKREELIGTNPRLLKSGEQSSAFYEELWETITSGRIWMGRFVNKRKDDTLYTEEATISPVRDATGTITNFVGMKRDISDHLALSKQLIHAQKMEAMGTLAGGIAHDVNNLLQIVLGQSDMLLQRGALDTKSRESVKAIGKAARNGAELVKRILMFGRKAEPEMRPINLSDEVRRVRELLRRTIPRMIGIEFSLQENLRVIHADSSQLEQILLNLAVNATDAMPDGGRLVFETRNTTIREEYCQTHAEVKPGKYVMLSVSDNGKGIETQALDRIFEPFFTTKQVGQGTGLGLSMVFGIVKNHGGHINCYSEVGIGTTFKIYFPVAETELPAAVEDTVEMPAGGTETLLLVDDEEAVRTLGAEMLELAGYIVLTAENGREALHVYDRNKDQISLVILDLVMPEMSGKTCIEELLKMDPEVKILIASGYSANGPTKDALQNGAAGFIGKPFDLKEILLAVRKSIDAGRRRD